MLKARLLTAMVLLPAFLAAVLYLPGPYWGGLVVLVTFIGALEWARVCGFQSLVRWAYGGFSALLSASTIAGVAGGYPGYPQLHVALFSVASIFWLVVAPLWLAYGWAIRSKAILSVVGWIVLVPMSTALVDLRAVGTDVLLGLMAIVWISDSAAYFSGRRFGRHKLAPSISPGKTWEGVAGAVAGVAIYALAWNGLGRATWEQVGISSIVSLALLFFMVTYLGIVGDLFESWMKRQAGIKDSGKILPGHGGVLDRIDALTAALPVAALATWWLQGEMVAK